MRILFAVIYFTCCSTLFGQAELVFPDHVEITHDKGIREVSWINRQTGDTVRKAYLKDGLIQEEVFSNYQKAFSKYIIDGTYAYTYKGLPLPSERLYSNSKEDTARAIYMYKGERILKREYWKSDRRSRIRKGAPEYGDGTEAGCIVREEDLIRYRKWIRDISYRYKYRKGQLYQTQINPFRNGQPDMVILAYENGRLVKQTERDKKRKTRNWEEVYSYQGTTIHMTKQYFITYWGKIPPTEKWTRKFDDRGREIKVSRTLEDTGITEMLVKSYNSNGNIVRMTLTRNSLEVVFDYVVSYQNLTNSML